MKIPEHISKKNDETTNNWAFTTDALETVMNYDLSKQDIWAAANIEIAKAQFLLDLYKTVFKIDNNNGLYEHLKGKNNFEEDIDYAYFQQYIVDTFYVLDGRLELWHKRPTMQYMRDSFFFAMNVMLSNRIAREYIPDTEERDLRNNTAKIVKAFKSTEAKNKINKRWIKYRSKEEKVFDCFRKDYEENGDLLFGNANDYLNKIYFITENYKIDGKGIGENKAKEWYSKVCKKTKII